MPSLARSELARLHHSSGCRKVAVDCGFLFVDPHLCVCVCVCGFFFFFFLLTSLGNPSLVAGFFAMRILTW